MLDNPPMTSTNQIDLQPQLHAFGQAFKRAYEQAGLSKRAVAIAVPLDRSAIGRIEKGLRGPKFETLLRMARATGTTPGALLGGDRGDDFEPQGTVEEAAKRLGENLKRLREAAEPALTQEEVALEARADRSSVSGYETGRVAPSVPTILKLAETLGVGAGVLLEAVGLTDSSERADRSR
jgi:transcriptional regulator with XRE-family HTH domain